MRDPTVAGSPAQRVIIGNYRLSGPCILYGELKQELKVVVGTVDLAEP